MKKVLFATTAAAALSISGAAFADGHGGDNFAFDGTTKVGYNSDGDAATTDDKGGIYMDTDINATASRTVGDYEIGATVEFDYDWVEGTGETTGFGFDNAYVKTPVGTLTFSESNDGGSASDLFYADRDGMATDVQNLDDLASLLWEGNVGSIDYAIDTGDIDNAANDDWSVGIGTSIAAGGGDIDLGFGYDNNSAAGGSSATGVSADFNIGMVSVGLSYITAAADSMGVAVGFDITPELNIGAYYADNSASDNKYGVTLDYASGPFTLAFDYDTGDGATVDNYEIDVSYDTGAGATIYAGYDDQQVPMGTTSTGAYYVGAEVEVADGITATVAYSEGHEVGGPEWNDGTSAFLTITY